MKIQNINSTAFNATKNINKLKNNDKFKSELASCVVVSAIVMSAFLVARDYMLNTVKEHSPEKYETLKNANSLNELKKEFVTVSDSIKFSQAQKAYYEAAKNIENKAK